MFHRQRPILHRKARKITSYEESSATTDTDESGCEHDGASIDDEDNTVTHEEDQPKPPRDAIANYVDKAIAGGVGKVNTPGLPTGGMGCPRIDSSVAPNNGVQPSTSLLRGSDGIHQKTVFGQIQGVLSGMTGSFTEFLLSSRACDAETGVLTSPSTDTHQRTCRKDCGDCCLI